MYSAEHEAWMRKSRIGDRMVTTFGVLGLLAGASTIWMLLHLPLCR